MFHLRRGREISGYEKLLLSGIPADSLLLGGESEVQLSDLAGNAMSMPVVSACMLAALCIQPYAKRTAAGRQDLDKDNVLDRLRQLREVQRCDTLGIFHQAIERPGNGCVVVHVMDAALLPFMDSVQHAISEGLNAQMSGGSDGQSAEDVEEQQRVMKQLRSKPGNELCADCSCADCKVTFAFRSLSC